MTPAEYRAAFERELGLTLDLETRDTLLEALRQGPGSRAWSEAMAIVGLREMARAQMTSPSRVRADRLWQRIDADLANRRRRGRFVAITARLLLAAIVVATGALLSWSLWRSL